MFCFNLKIISKSLCGQELNFSFLPVNISQRLQVIWKQRKCLVKANQPPPLLTHSWFDTSWGISEFLKSLPMVLCDMLAGCFLWPLLLEITLPADKKMFAALLLQLRKAPWHLVPLHQGWSRIHDAKCCFSSVAVLVPAPGFLLPPPPPLQPIRAAVPRCPEWVKGMRCLWGTG